MPLPGAAAGLLPQLLQRELGGCRGTFVPNSFSHAFTCSGQRAGVIRVDPDGEPCPPYSITFNQVVHGCRLLTVGDEEGCVSIVDTSAEQLPASLYTDLQRPPRAKWLAHNNTIFDMAWGKHDSVLFTASGDQQVGVWDTTAGRLRVYCAGHEGSVKAVRPHSSQPDVFASGSRDGVILLWDLRSPTTWSAARRRPQLAPVLRISIAATPASQHGPTPAAALCSATAASAGPGVAPGSSGGSRRRPSGGGGSTRRSVTSLLFVGGSNEHTLISSSDMDGVVKLWDLRRLPSPAGELVLPAAAAAAAGGSGGGRGGKRGRTEEPDAVCWLGLSCPSRSSRPAGITSMSLSPAGDTLLVSSIDAAHYLYSLSALDAGPTAVLGGHRTNSFCVKSCFSPDGRRVLSGSSDKNAYIWDVTQPAAPPVVLPGHAGEVTAVAWCPGDACQLATAADDATLRVWALDRDGARYQRQFEHFNYDFRAAEQQAFWERLGMGSSGSSSGGGASASTAKAAAGRPMSGAGAGAAGGRAASIASPTTPQLPLWRTGCPDGAGAGAGAGEQCHTPAMQLRQGFLSPLPQQPPQQGLQQPSPQPLAPGGQHSQAREQRQAAGTTPPSAQGLTPAAGAEAQKQQQQQRQAGLAGEACSRAAAAGNAVEVPASAGVFDAWMNNLTPSPAASQGCSPSPHRAATAAVAAGTPAAVTDTAFQQPNCRPPGAADSCEKQQQPPGVGGLFGGRSINSSSVLRRGSRIEASTPWELPSPIRRQRRAEQAALESQRLVQSQQQLQRLALGPSRHQQGQAPLGAAVAVCDDDWEGAGISCCRLLQDDFEVFCDDTSDAGSDGGSPRGARVAAAAAAPAGSSMAEGLSSGPEQTRAGTPCQENVWQQQQQQQARAAAAAAVDAAAAAEACMFVAATPAELDVVPASLPVDGTQDAEAEQLQSQHLQHQQPQSQVRRAFVGAPAIAGPCHKKPGEVLLGPNRRPLGDLSTLMPLAAPEAPASPYSNPSSLPAGAPAAAAAAAAASWELARQPRHSPVRALSLPAAGAGSGPLLDAAGSPLMQLLQHNRAARQQQQQQQQRHMHQQAWECSPGKQAGVAGLLMQSPERAAAATRHQSPGAAGFRRLSRLGERQLPPLLPSPSSAAAAAATYAQQQQQQQQQQGDTPGPGPTAFTAAAGAADAAIKVQHAVVRQPASAAAAAAAGASVQAEEPDGACGEHTPAGAAGEGGGGARRLASSKRSSAGPGSIKKRQCKLADLWTAREEVEDSHSRFSGH